MGYTNITISNESECLQMLYMHEKNITTKIHNNYKNHGISILQFYEQKYLPMRRQIESLTFNLDHLESFQTATAIFNSYYDDLKAFETNYKIDTRSKFSSTFLEEISVYLFKDLPEIKNSTYGFFNKGIYAGLKIDSNYNVAVIKKDVDFCIGKKVTITIDEQAPIELILPLIAVEVKTYLDATMFGEVKSSSKAIRSASPNSKTYVLMGHKELADEHIIAARQDSTLSEMFVLRKDALSPIDNNTLYLYWKEIAKSIEDINMDTIIDTPGKLLRR